MVRLRSGTQRFPRWSPSRQGLFTSEQKADPTPRLFVPLSRSWCFVDQGWVTIQIQWYTARCLLFVVFHSILLCHFRGLPIFSLGPCSHAPHSLGQSRVCIPTRKTGQFQLPQGCKRSPSRGSEERREIQTSQTTTTVRIYPFWETAAKKKWFWGLGIRTIQWLSIIYVGYFAIFCWHLKVLLAFGAPFASWATPKAHSGFGAWNLASCCARIWVTQAFNWYRYR